MIPAAFEQENAVFDTPEGMSPEEVSPISAWHGLIGDKEFVVTCWKATKEELEEINKTGRVWLLVMGKTMPPVYLDGISIFKTPNYQGNTLEE